jgi:hypothetical protein
MPLARALLTAASLAFAVVTAAAAQTPAFSRVFVTAKDSAGVPVPGAELVATLGLNTAIAHGTTDSAGHGTLTFNVPDTSDVQITMRKIGYPRGDRFIEIAPRSALPVTIVVAPHHGQMLGTVQVTAREDSKRRSYFIDADAIAAFDRPLDDGWDVVRKMRPDMLTSRGGCATGIQDVWVNGTRIVLPLKPVGRAATYARVGVPAYARYSYIPVTVLSEISPEHIESMTYHDCFDDSVGMVGSTNALFVVLKPGVEYVQDVGSFVVDSASSGGAP